MPERVGRYQILEQIGRGGLGVIFKARDPLFDRAVALKWFSPEIAVTDEFRAPFFRAAQICVRLNHPNIITVHDVGEDAGRFFIAMELVEGEDLRRIIAERRLLALEDKLSVMVQVCEGLHYAHQQGIVHGYLTPRNIFLSEGGRVKLDFSVGQIVGTNSDPMLARILFRTTRRYLAPEQLRGQADHRSDIFVVGALFYELLSSRPPFISEDPMQLLEQLQTEDPPSLVELDRTIPPDLAAIVERAMRKDPRDRFPDLEQVRSRIERLQRGLREETQRLRTRLRDQLDRIFRLRTMLADRIGTLPEEEALPRIEDRGGLAAMQAIERDFATRIAALQDKVDRAEALVPAYLRGIELLRTLQSTDAAAEFEAIIADMPEHTRAQESLLQARAQAEEQRRRQLTADLLQDARVAFDGGAYVLCLEILGKARDVPAPAATAQELAALAGAAAAALQAEEAARREWRSAERAREEMVQAQREAQDQGASDHARDLWTEAEARAAEAQGYLAQSKYAEAGQAFQSATAALRRAMAEAGAARVRERGSPQVLEPDNTSALDLDATMFAVPRAPAGASQRQPATTAPWAATAPPDLSQTPPATTRPIVADSRDQAVIGGSRDDPSTTPGKPGQDDDSVLDLDATVLAVPRGRIGDTAGQPATAASRADTPAGEKSATERIEAPLRGAAPDDTSPLAFDVTRVSMPRASPRGHEVSGETGGFARRKATSRARLRAGVIGLGLLAAIAIIYWWIQ